MSRRRGWTIEDLARRDRPVNLRWNARVRDSAARKYRSKSFAAYADAVAFCKEHAPALNKPRKPRYDFNPNWTVHPGELIAEHLRELGKAQLWLAKRMKRPPSQVNRLINGRINVTAVTALQLERVLKRPAQYWMNLQTSFDLFHARKKLER